MGYVYERMRIKSLFLFLFFVFLYEEVMEKCLFGRKESRSYIMSMNFMNLAFFLSNGNLLKLWYFCMGINQ